MPTDTKRQRWQGVRMPEQKLLKYITCPHCGTDYDETEFNNPKRGVNYPCDECGKSFSWRQVRSPLYDIRKVKEPRHAD